MALTKISTAMISQSAAAVDLNVDAGTFYVDTTNNRVGVGGKTDPDTPLHVIGTVTATTFAGSGASLTDIPNSALTNSSITINSTAVSLGGSLTLTTANIGENTNLYYTDARVDARIAAADTDDLSEGSSNLYYTDARVDARVSGGSLGNITTTGYIRGPSSFTIDPAAHGDDTGTVVIAGNLQVDGVTTTINSTTLTVDDKNITLASGSVNAAAASGAGFTVDIGTGTLPAITYDGTNDEWDFNKPLSIQTNLLLSSSASNSIISESGSGGLFLRGSSISVQNSSNANMIQALSTGAVTLYHNGAPKIATSSSGASITGILNVTGNIVVSGTVDGVDIAARDAILTSTTTTANAALPLAGGTMTGTLAINTDSPELYFGTTGNHYNWRIAAQELVDEGFEIAVGSQDTDYSNDTYVNKFVVKASGNVGIGTDSPPNPLSVRKTISAYEDVISIIGQNSPTDIMGALAYDQSTDLMIIRNDQTYATGGIAFRAGGTSNHLFIKTGGNVGIGTDTPDYLLDVSKSTVGGVTDMRVFNEDTTDAGSGARGIIAVANASVGDPRLVLGITGIKEYSLGIDNSDGDKFKINDGSDPSDGTNYLTIDSGNVGIGTDNPSALLHLKSTADAAGPSLIFENTNNAQSMNIDYWSNAGAVQSRIEYAEGPASWNFIPNVSTSASALYIAYDGKVGIGTNAPDTILEIRNPTLATDTVNTLLTQRWSRAQTAAVKWGNSLDLLLGSYESGTINSRSRVDFRLANGATDDPDTTVMTLQGNGNVGIGTDAPGVPLHVKKTGSTSAVQEFLRFENHALGGAGAGSSINFHHYHAGGGPTGGAKAASITAQNMATWPAGTPSSYSSGLTFGTLHENTFAERMRLGATGALELGYGGATRQQADSQAFSIITPATGGGQGIAFKRLDSNNDQGLGEISWSNNTQDGQANIRVKTAGAVNSTDMHFDVNNAGTLVTAISIDGSSGGNVGIGTDSPNSLLELRKTTGGYTTSGTGNKGAVLTLHHEAQWESAYGTGGSTPDWLGAIDFSTGDGSAGEGIRASIRTTVNNYYNTNDLVFYTANQGDTTLDERMRITHGGDVNIAGDLTAATVHTSESQSNNVTKLLIDNTGGLPTAGTQQGGAVTFRSFLGDSNMREAAEIRGVYLGTSTDTNKNRGGLVFRTHNPDGLTDSMLIDEDGNVGIGTTPQSFSKLQVKATTDQHVSIFTNSKGLTIGGLTDTGGSGALRIAGAPLHLTGQGGGTGSGPDIAIISGGNVGIGTDAPDAKLDIKSQLNMTNSDDVSLLGLKATRFGYSATYRVLQIGSGAATTSDNLAIGVDLSTNASGSFTGYGESIYFRNDVTFRTPNSTNDGFHTYTTMKDGNVGIGTTNPTSKLDLVGDLTVDAAIHKKGEYQSTYGATYNGSEYIARGLSGIRLHTYTEYVTSWNPSTETKNVFEVSHDSVNWADKYIMIELFHTQYSGGGYARYYWNSQYNSNSLIEIEKNGNNSGVTAAVSALTTVSGNVKKSIFSLTFGYYMHAHVRVTSNMPASTSITASNQLRFLA